MKVKLTKLNINPGSVSSVLPDFKRSGDLFAKNIDSDALLRDIKDLAELEVGDMIWVACGLRVIKTSPIKTFKVDLDGKGMTFESDTSTYEVKVLEEVTNEI